VSTNYQLNKFARTAGGQKTFLKQVPTEKSRGFPAGQSATDTIYQEMLNILQEVDRSETGNNLGSGRNIHSV